MAEPTTKVVTGEGRLSYAHLNEPRAQDGGEPKYSTAFIFSKSDRKTAKAIQAAIEAAVQQGLTSKWGGKRPKMKDILRDGDEEKEGDPAYEGMYFFNCSSKNKPSVVKKSKTQGVFINCEPDEIYSGMVVKLSINLFPFDSKGNKGVGIGLNGVFKVRDDEPLGSTFNAAVDFGSELSDEDYDDQP